MERALFCSFRGVGTTVTTPRQTHFEITCAYTLIFFKIYQKKTNKLIDRLTEVERCAFYDQKYDRTRNLLTRTKIFPAQLTIAKMLLIKCFYDSQTRNFENSYGYLSLPQKQSKLQN